LDEELSHLLDSDALGTLHTLLPPELPAALSVGQAAQLSELLLYFHLRLRGLIATAKALPKSESVVIDQRQWQALLDLQDRLATYLRQIGEPVD
jgi:hypothetical protein